MYLHLGQDIVVRQRDVIGVFDMDNTTISSNTRSFLSRAEKNGRVSYVSMDLPKSFIVCAEDGKTPDNTTVYISQISPRTLGKRADIMNTIGINRGGFDDE